MIVTCLGHAKFCIELADGFRIVCDPFDASTGYEVGHTRCDAVLVSHHHHDHDAVETLHGYTQVIDTPGVHTLSQGVKVTGIASYHDDANGTKRGPNVMYLIEADDLRIAHLGDLGHPLSTEQAEALDLADVVMVPVGGFFTIDAPTAAVVCRQIHARTILPMHYRTQVNADWPIAPVEDFLSLVGDAERLQELRVTREDLACQPHVAVLENRVIE